MRIDKVHIENFKNLRDFDINLDENELNTVLLGQNATGKSNFIEALVLIFKYLDLSDSNKRVTPEFEYKISYLCRSNVIDINCSLNKKSKKNSYLLKVNGKKLSLKDFFSNKNTYLPKYVFTYYSGVSNKLKNLFDDNQEKFYTKIISEDVTKDEVEDLRRMFYVQLVHSYFVLLAFYTFEEERTKEFLYKYLDIEDLDSVLFKFHQKPKWAKRAKSFKDNFMWGARGLVREFLDKLWEISLAPIDNVESYKENFRDSDNKTMEYLYLFVSDKAKLQKLKEYYQSNTDLFKALESTYISDLIKEVKVNVKKRNVENSVTFKELSEGEQQLLTVLGLLKFTKDKETLVLLDEPDTHLNPLWKWEYIELLKDIYKRDETGAEDKTTHIIINTHDPLVIGGLDKEQVRIFRRDDSGKVYVDIPDKSPKGMGVAGILTSDLFGLPTILDKETQAKLNRKRFLQGKMMRNDISEEDYLEYQILKGELEEYGFYEEVEDKWFKMYLAEMSKYEIIQKVEFTEEEKKYLEEVSKGVIESIKNKMNSDKT